MYTKHVSYRPSNTRPMTPTAKLVYIVMRNREVLSYNGDDQINHCRDPADILH